jgi:hypothetical protein
MTTWDETVPVVGEDASNGYSRIQDVKKGVRERIATEHDADTGTTKTWRHKFPQVASAATRDAVTQRVDGWMCFRTDIRAIQVQRAGATSGWDTYYGAFIGETKMFQGAQASIPVGWTLSDGDIHNGFQTVDLRGQFIVGANPGGGGDYDTTNVITTPKTAGSSSHKVLQANIEAFETTDSAVLSTGTLSDTITSTGALLSAANPPTGTLTVGTVGATEIDHRPEYYALFFIVYVGLAVGD